MQNVTIDTISVDGVFMVDRRVTKINATRYARRSTDEKSEMKPKGYQMIGLSQLGRTIDLNV